MQGAKPEQKDEGPERLCIVTRAVRPVGDLVRFVLDPEGVVVPDIRNRLPGRGVWVTGNRETVSLAIRRKAFSRGLRADARVPDDLCARVEHLLERDALQMLSMANKAGAIIAGFAKIDGAKGAMLALIQATDGSGAEIARLQRLCRGRGPNRSDPAIVRAFSAEQLGLSIGREHVIHAALAVHEAGAAFLERTRRVLEFRSGGPAEPIKASASGPAGALDIVVERSAGAVLSLPAEENGTND